MIPRADCEHNTLMFGSGDYYIFCQDCDARWGALRAGVAEYEFGIDGKVRVGCDPTVCTNTTPLSGLLRKC